MTASLPLIWGGIIGFCIIMYVILDGFTLGTGMLLPTLNKHEKDIAMSVVLPTWDGNQTWLVLGMAMLYGAFPLAFSVLLPAFYLPLIFMTVILLFRGVAFEFRLKAYKKHYWDGVFFISSLMAAFIQGTIVANLVQGIQQPHTYFNAFSILVGFGLVFAYLLLGSTRLILKTQDSLQEKMFRLSRWIMLIVSLLLMTVCIATPFVTPQQHSIWTNLAHWTDLYFLPAITFCLGLALWLSIKHKENFAPYWISVLFVLCPFIGFAINLYPYAVPYQITLWQAASQPSTLIFLLVGAVIMLPILLIYTAYAYYIFRGKVTDAIHY